MISISSHKLTFYLFYLLGFLFLWTSCANKVSLTGGPKDLDPPLLDTALSTANYQLRYEPSQIYMEFDEFINFKNPAKQVVISPPLEYPLNIDQRGKKIEVNFDENEKFKENATYILSFGESISDYTENNTLTNFSYVFSTGDYIDSLNISGTVIDALTKKPVENMTVMLYDILEDSIVYKERPFYFAKTDKKGLYELKNLRADTFKIVVLEDLNLDYTYQEAGERFGFIKENIILTDSLDEAVTIELYKSKSIPRYEDSKVLYDGLLTLIFDQELSTNPSTLLNNVASYSELDGRSVKYYIEDIDMFPLQFSIPKDSLRDTISVRRPQSKDQKNLPDLKILKTNVDATSGLHPLDTLMMEFNLPLYSINYDSLKMDSTQVWMDEENLRRMYILEEWEEGEDYTFSLDSNSIIDFYKRPIDSTGYNFEVGRKNSFGSISVSFDSLTAESNYIVSLRKKEEVLQKWLNINTAMDSISIDRLPPETYNFYIIEDTNRNGVWDPGVYLEKKYSERIFEVNIEPLKENRNLEVKINFEELANKKISSDEERDIKEIDK